MEKETDQKISLPPKSYIIFAPGLKMENITDTKLTFRLPAEVIYDTPVWKDIKIVDVKYD